MLTPKQTNALVSALANEALANLIADDLETQGSGLAGDIILDISPSVAVRPPTSNAFNRTVVLTLKNANGKVHRWANQTFTGVISVGDTSTAGTASVASADVTFVEGVAKVVLSGDAQDWLDTETNTLTVANLTITGYTITGGTSVETITT